MSDLFTQLEHLHKHTAYSLGKLSLMLTRRKLSLVVVNELATNLENTAKELRQIAKEKQSGV